MRDELSQLSIVSCFVVDSPKVIKNNQSKMHNQFSSNLFFKSIQREQRCSSNYIVKFILLLSLLLFVQMASSHSDLTPQYDEVPANVPYSAVSKLDATTHAKTISYGESPEQIIYYWPAIGQKKKQTLMFVHGGCWLEQYTIAHSFAMTSALAQHGFEVYSVEYRRSGNGGEWPVALNDVELALSKIHQHIAKPNLPHTEAFSIIGHSAGGHLATLAGIRAENSLFANLHVFGLAPIIDLVSYSKGSNSCQSVTKNFMGGLAQERPKAYQDASPLEYAFTTNIIRKNKAGLGSVTMLIGTKDNIVPQSMAMHPNARFSLSENAGHFDWIHPGSPAFKELLMKLDEL